MCQKKHLVLNDSELGQLSDLNPGRLEHTMQGKPFLFMYIAQKTLLCLLFALEKLSKCKHKVLQDLKNN